jgi:hypothetical protein
MLGSHTPIYSAGYLVKEEKYRQYTGVSNGLYSEHTTTINLNLSLFSH